MPSKTSLTNHKKFEFVPEYESLAAIMVDHELAALGDAYINFVYSLALSKKLRKPVGRKVSSSLLASALKKAGLRKSLPSRMDRHRQADAAEALLVYAWLKEIISLEQTTQLLEKEESDEGAFTALLQTISERVVLTP